MDDCPPLPVRHGAREEPKLGSLANHGFIRMANGDVIEMFDHAHVGERVIIRR